MLIFRNLAIILIAAKLCGLLARKLKAPQVVGEIVAGLLIGPAVLGLVVRDDFLIGMAEIGVILLMFSAGLGTNLRELVKTGPVALLIAIAGVFVPLAGGAAVYYLFGFGTPDTRFYEAIFMGTILSATSVSITVQALKEMGKLKSRVGTTILSAAILDDIIGIILLTVVIGLKNPEVSPTTVCIKTILFFVFSIVLGFGLYFVFKWIDKRWPHSRRVPIFGLALCFAAAFCAEHFFGIADITGAYVAGIILCNIKDSEYIERKMDVSSYMIFGPVFFASIGLQTSFNNFSMQILWFSIAIVAVGLMTKIIGCGSVARLCKFNTPDSVKIGLGMMTRGEVALIVAQKGLNTGLMAPEFFTSIIILIIVSSIATPILLKVMYSKFDDSDEHTSHSDDSEHKVLAQESVGATYNISEKDFADKSN